MHSESKFISIIENYPSSANFKEVDTGKYVVANRKFARSVGACEPNDLLGLTVRDLPGIAAQANATPWQEKQVAEHKQKVLKLAQLDFLVQEEKKTIQSNFVFCDAQRGDVRYEQVVKLPIFDQMKHVIGIATYQNDMAPTLSLNDIYDLNRRFHDVPEAIRRVLDYIGVTQYFTTHPTEAPFRIFLAKAERHSSKAIARNLGISNRTVEYQLDALRNRVTDGDLRRVFALVRRKTNNEFDQSNGPGTHGSRPTSA